MSHDFKRNVKGDLGMLVTFIDQCSTITDKVADGLVPLNYYL
jgi:hypothetical protein